MNRLLGLLLLAVLIIVHTLPASSYHPDFTWRRVESMMSPDLKHRMVRGEKMQRRNYCGDCNSIDEDASYRICGNDGIMYPNSCTFECNQIEKPELKEAEDYGICGTITFTEFKQPELKSNY